MARSKKVDVVNSQTRRVKPDAKDAQSGPVEAVGHQEPQTADEAAPAADVPQDDAKAGETAQAETETAEEGASAGAETGAGLVEVTEAAGETGGAEAIVEPTDAPDNQQDGQAAKSAEAPASSPAMDTDAALALRRFEQAPKCACGCGKTLPNPKKHFIIGHDGKAKATLRRVMRGELPPEAVPTELILRHREIRFVMASPEFHSLVESWQKAK